MKIPVISLLVIASFAHPLWSKNQVTEFESDAAPAESTTLIDSGSGKYICKVQIKSNSDKKEGTISISNEAAFSIYSTSTGSLIWDDKLKNTLVYLAGDSGNLLVQQGGGTRLKSNSSWTVQLKSKLKRVKGTSLWEVDDYVVLSQGKEPSDEQLNQKPDKEKSPGRSFEIFPIRKLWLLVSSDAAQ